MWTFVNLLNLFMDWGTHHCFQDETEHRVSFYVLFYFTFERERERERESTSRGGAEREKETESEAGSRL